MPSARWVQWEGELWTIRRLADANRIAPATLANRLNRFGETITGIQRALATGILDKHQSGIRGALRSPWRYPGS
jgi:hypothetical protein